jgi:alcohol dehydrogenase
MTIQTFFSPTRIYAGAGAHQKIADVLKSYDSKRIFIAADHAVLNSEIMTSIRASLDANGIAYTTFSDIEPDPSDVTVAKAFEQSRSHGATALLAVGGGSTIDVAKAVGILATNGGRIHDYEGTGVFTIPPLPLVALPTTAGTGSEVSGSCVVTDTRRNLKMSIRDPLLNPARVAILDPIALKTMPASVAMHSGVDAFVHAFESFISREANPFTDALNLRALELIYGNIRTFVRDRTNLEAGAAMLTGSALTGMAFGITGTGNVHCIARFIGAYFHLSHGLSNAICLPRVAEFNRLAAVARYARLAQIFAPDAPKDPEIASTAVVTAIVNLCRDLEVPQRLRDVGGRADVLEEMADHCIAAGYNRWNPRETTREDFLTMLTQLY